MVYMPLYKEVKPLSELEVMLNHLNRERVYQNGFKDEQNDLINSSSQALKKKKKKKKKDSKIHR